VPVFGVPIADLDLSQLLSAVSRAVEARSGEALTIAYANAHTCNLAWTEPQFRDDLQRMGVVYVDGNGPRVAAWLKGRSLPRRMTGADWINDLCQQCQRRSHSLYILGGAEGVASLAAERLRARHPGLEVRGVRSGFASDGEWPDIVRSVAAARPDILLIGMQSPGQERWIVRHAGELGIPVVWGTGGMLDYASGVLRRPPRWMRSLALEWLGRMLIDPRRLAWRYLAGLPLFIARSIADALAWRLRGRGWVA
jgi:N-acetylglucosaminyldiphosphoundecaprenol N-acetyl-beta-D-mannosaminyltransferase